MCWGGSPSREARGSMWATNPPSFWAGGEAELGSDRRKVKWKVRCEWTNQGHRVIAENHQNFKMDRFPQQHLWSHLLQRWTDSIHMFVIGRIELDLGGQELKMEVSFSCILKSVSLSSLGAPVRNYLRLHGVLRKQSGLMTSGLASSRLPLFIQQKEKCHDKLPTCPLMIKLSFWMQRARSS